MLGEPRGRGAAWSPVQDGGEQRGGEEQFGQQQVEGVGRGLGDGEVATQAAKSITFLYLSAPIIACKIEEFLCTL